MNRGLCRKKIHVVRDGSWGPHTCGAPIKGGSCIEFSHKSELRVEVRYLGLRTGWLWRIWAVDGSNILTHCDHFYPTAGLAADAGRWELRIQLEPDPVRRFAMRISGIPAPLVMA